MAEAFEELDVYKAARVLRQRVFKLVKKLPHEELYVLVPQMRRAALSVTNNIAEGHGSRGWKHNISYLYRARGSVTELLDDFSACEDEQHFSKEHLDDIRAEGHRVMALINGYITYLRRRLADETPASATSNARKSAEDDRSTD